MSEEIKMKTTEEQATEETGVQTPEEKKPGFVTKVKNFASKNKGKIIAAATAVGVGIIGYVLGTKVNRIDDDDCDSYDEETNLIPFNGDDSDVSYDDESEEEDIG